MVTYGVLCSLKRLPVRIVKLRTLMSKPTASNCNCSSASGSQASCKPKILVIAGATSVGKTELSLQLAALLNGEVISADSAQVFRQLNIGSAKVSPEVASRVPHHLLDVVDIDAEEKFSMADFCLLGNRAIKDVLSRGRVPLIVGGTGLYIRSLLEGGTVGAPSSTVETRAFVDRLLQEDGEDWEKSLARLTALDPVYAATLFPNDWYRLKRALEICHFSGTNVTAFKRNLAPEDYPYDSKCLFLSMPRVKLYERIDARCESIIEEGLLQEVISLVKAGRLKADSQAGRCLGYRQALEYLRDVWGFPQPQGEEGGRPYLLQVQREELRKYFYDFLLQYKSVTRQLAQHQQVWFKSKPEFHWLNMAPGGVRLSAGAVGEAVASWFREGTPLPEEWDGKGLTTLTPSEQLQLKEYSTTHSSPTLFADGKKVDALMATIESLLQS